MIIKNKSKPHVAKTNISRPSPPSPSTLCTAPTPREVEVVKPLHFPVRDAEARAQPAFPVSRAKLSNGVSYVSPLPPAPFLPRAHRLQAVSSREILNIQAGQSGIQMGTKF